MADDHSTTSAVIAKPTVDGPYTVGDFAKKHGLSIDRAQMLMDTIGTDHIKLDAAAGKLKAWASD